MKGDDKCPFPGCALDDWHEGEHIPRLRLIQRYSWLRSRCESWSLYTERREIDIVDRTLCRNVSCAYYETAAGRGVELCAECEEDLVNQGATVLGIPELAVARFGPWTGSEAA